jgi:hypothetical protein
MQVHMYLVLWCSKSGIVQHTVENVALLCIIQYLGLLYIHYAKGCHGSVHSVKVGKTRHQHGSAWYEMSVGIDRSVGRGSALYEVSAWFCIVWSVCMVLHCMKFRHGSALSEVFAWFCIVWNVGMVLVCVNYWDGSSISELLAWFALTEVMAWFPWHGSALSELLAWICIVRSVGMVCIVSSVGMVLHCMKYWHGLYCLKCWHSSALSKCRYAPTEVLPWFCIVWSVGMYSICVVWSVGMYLRCIKCWHDLHCLKCWHGSALCKVLECFCIIWMVDVLLHCLKCW